MFSTEIFIFKYSPTWKQLKCPSIGKLMTKIYDQYKKELVGNLRRICYQKYLACKNLDESQSNYVE